MAQNGQNPVGPQNPPIPQPPGAQERFFQALVDQLAQNRGQAQAPSHSAKSIPCEVYRAGQDFDQWLNLFVDSVRAVNNLPVNDPRLTDLCLRWLPTKLESGSPRTVYQNLAPATKSDWTLLTDALSKSFKDDSDEIRFLSDESAWVKSPSMSLREYKDGLILRLEKYQPGLKAVEEEYQRAAVRRFRLGLQNPILSSHILLSCTGTRHTLQNAYECACNFENTLLSLSSSGNKNAAPSLASFLNFPQISAMSTDVPVVGALSAAQEKRFDSLESSVKKGELDLAELKSSIVELKEGFKEVKTELMQPRRPSFQRPMFPSARMPVTNAYSRPYNPGYKFTRFQTVVPGLTQGPGYVSRYSVPVNRAQTYANTRHVSPVPNATNQAKDETAAGKETNGDQNKVIGAMGTDGQADAGQAFPNPQLQYGLYDEGYGWTDSGWGGECVVQPDGTLFFDEDHFVQ